jgi:hypothetical protein
MITKEQISEHLLKSCKFIPLEYLDAFTSGVRFAESVYSENFYVLVHWPEVQDFMSEDWFENEAVLHFEESSAYFMPVERIKQYEGES